MATTINELFNSQSSTTGNVNATCEILYMIQDAADKDEAITILVATAPSSQTVDGETLPLQELDVDPRGGDNWLATATYARVAPDPGRNKETGESYYNFEVSTETAHITHSIDTPQTLGTAPDEKGAINVSGQGPNRRIEGTDILVPTHVFSETHYLSDATVSTAYRKIIAFLTGKYNDAVFRDFAIGEVLFLGASGTKRGSGNWEITYRFGVRENDAAFSVTGVAGTVAKKGWEYAWVRTARETSGSDQVFNNLGAYIEQIYEEGDFSTLGI